MSYYVNFNDIIISDFLGFGVVSTEMPTIPAREISSKNIWKRDGDIFFSSRNTTRKISINFNVQTNNSEDYLQTVDDLKSCFMTKELSKLYVGSEDKYINAVVTDYSFSDVFLTDSIQYGEGEIVFFCADPFFYKGDEKYYDSNTQEELNNEGDVEAYPNISIEFKAPAMFLQIDSENGNILIGDYPSKTKQDLDDTPIVLEDKCNSLSDWIVAGNMVDEGSTGETLVVNTLGKGLSPNISGTNEGWHGACYRRNLNREVKDFEMTAWFEFYSDKLDNADSVLDSNTTGNYKVTSSVSLRIRSGRGTNYKILGSMPSGTLVTVTDISSGWGKVTYNGITGYSSMQHLKKITTSNYNYKTTANLNMRSGRSTKYKILRTIPKGISLYITSISGGWGKTTYKGSMGYVYMGYVTKLATASALTIIGKEDDSDVVNNDEDMLGLCELYGLDLQGNKLFKTQLLDNNYYYKDTKPSVFIKGECVLTDSTKCPEPKTKTDENGNKEKILSGDSGSNWNGFMGNFKIKRENDVWSIEVNKCTSGLKVIKSISKQNLKTTSSSGNLAYLVVYMAGYGSYKVQNMSLISLEVKALNEEQTVEEYNPIIFKEGDIIDIDCNENIIYKNGAKFMEYLDIGSRFFSLNTGLSSINIFSSTTELSAAVKFTERFY